MVEAEIIQLEVGIILVIGFLGAIILRRIGVPQVLGFILSGIVIGLADKYIEIISLDIDFALKALSSVALGFIGFNIGAELNWNELKKVDKKLLYILLADSFGTFALVSLAVYFFTSLPFHFALILGALASATAPAATADVLWEYKSKGPLTQAVLFILALDDIIAIFLVQLTFNGALAKEQGSRINFMDFLTDFLYEVGLAIIIGVLSAVFIIKLINRVDDQGEVIELILGTLLLVIGLTTVIHVSGILACILFGVILASFAKRDTDEAFHGIFKLGNPIVATFFIVVGIGMNFGEIKLIGAIGIVYLLSRTLGKVGGVSLAGRMTGADERIQKYLGLCLFSQAGVAIGLAVQIFEDFQGAGAEAEHNAGIILSTITGTILIVQIIGPLLVKWSIHQAGEAEMSEIPKIGPV